LKAAALRELRLSFHIAREQCSGVIGRVILDILAGV